MLASADQRFDEVGDSCRDQVGGRVGVPVTDRLEVPSGLAVSACAQLDEANCAQGIGPRVGQPAATRFNQDVGGQLGGVGTALNGRAPGQQPSITAGCTRLAHLHGELVPLLRVRLGEPEPAPRDLIGCLVLEIPGERTQRSVRTRQPPGIAVQAPAQLVLAEPASQGPGQSHQDRIGERLDRGLLVRRGRCHITAGTGLTGTAQEQQHRVLRIVRFQRDVLQPARELGPGLRPVGTGSQVAVHRDGGREAAPIKAQYARDPGPDEVHRVLGRAGELGHDGAHHHQRYPILLAELRFALRSVEQSHRLLGEPAQGGCVRRGPQPPSPARAVRRELSRPRQRGHGRGGATAQGRLFGRALQLFGCLLVGSHCGLAEMPGTAMLVGRAVEGRGKRSMDRGPPISRGAVIDRGPDQRMPEHQPRPVVGQKLVKLDPAQRAGVDLQGRSRLLENVDAARAMGGDELQQWQRLGMPRPDPGQERALQFVGHGERLLRALLGLWPCGKFDQGQGVSARGGQEAVLLAIGSGAARPGTRRAAPWPPLGRGP